MSDEKRKSEVGHGDAAERRSTFAKALADKCDPPPLCERWRTS